MHFADPEYWNFYWLIPGLVVFAWWSFRQKRRALLRFAEIHLIERLICGTSKARQLFKVATFLLSVSFLLLALVRPQWGTRYETVKRKGIDLLVVLDTSLSMDTQDVPPNRLEKAKHEIRALIDRLQGDRVGLVVFAGMSQVNCPLTIDQNAVRLFLEIIDTAAIPLPGTNIGEALRTATRAFNSGERRYKVVILVTDGESLEGDPLKAAEEAGKAGVVIYALGIGTAAGQPIPLHDDKGNVVGYKKSEEGSVVVSRLEESTLANLASVTGGQYFRATPGEEEVERIAGLISQMDRKEFQSRQYLTLVDRFQIPLGIGLFLVVLEMVVTDETRKGKGIGIGG
ncbi:MAG TPA: VWA domain-containing protein [Terriglobia bacterium]|nr:VWA domain-containing protein [Terriglobia bacterium]